MSLYSFFGYITLPVITTSVRFVPDIKLANVGPAASLPCPYEGKGATTGYSDSSYFKKKPQNKNTCN